MNKQKLLSDLKSELKKYIDPEYKESCQNFHKQPVKHYGVRTPITRKIGREFYKQVKDISKNELFEICESLMKSEMQEEFTIASAWVFRRKKEFEKSDFITFERWVNKYISNWGACDDFCTKSLGYLILEFPTLIPKIKTWTKSNNQWVRRACAVSFIIPVRNKKYLDQIFEIALDLLQHPEDMVQKGYGWMLKEAANIYQKQVFDFVMKNKDLMPRTALRYAIEKMPKNLKEKAMS